MADSMAPVESSKGAEVVPSSSVAGKTTEKAPWTSLFQNNRKFVEAYKLEKNGKHSEPIALCSNDLDELKSSWGYCVVGFVAGRFPGRIAFENLMSSWGVPCKLIVHASGWTLFKLQSEADKITVLGGGPYSIFGRPLVLKDMPPFFTFDDKFLSVIPCWINLPGLPLECWNNRALSRIASAVGDPIAMDKLTAERERISYARVLVEVDASAPIVDKVDILLPNGVELAQSIIYETAPKFCVKCKRIGHKVEECNVSLPNQGFQRKIRVRSRTRLGSRNGGFVQPSNSLMSDDPSTTKSVRGSENVASFSGMEANLGKASVGLVGPGPVPSSLEAVRTVDEGEGGTGKTTLPKLASKNKGGGNIISRDRLVGSLVQNPYSILGGINVGTVVNPVLTQKSYSILGETNTNMGLLENLVSQGEAEHQTQHDIGLAVKEIPTSEGIEVMYKDIFVAKVRALVKEDERPWVLKGVRRCLGKEAVCSEKEKEQETFEASLIRLVNRLSRVHLIARLESRRANLDAGLIIVSESAESSEETESFDEDIDLRTKDPVDEDDFISAGSGSRAKKKRGGRGGRGNRRR